MKRLLLFGIICSIGFAGFSQNRVIPSQHLRNLELVKTARLHQSDQMLKTLALPSAQSAFSPEETTIGTTRYDLQSNSGCQNRFHVYEDGTMGATWTYGINDPNFADRGTGYNYFDGTVWGSPPSARIETIRAGWPSYAPYGENGEIVVSHNFANGTLFIESRDQKGIGAWSESFFIGPSDQKISWPVQPHRA